MEQSKKSMISKWMMPKNKTAKEMKKVNLMKMNALTMKRIETKFHIGTSKMH